MQIQCPHCKSRYRLGADMIDAYGGFVRCGNCNYKFNIHDQVLIEDEPSELVNTTQRPGLGANRSAGPEESGGARRERIEPRLERDEEEDAFNIRFGPDGSSQKDDAVSLEDFYEPRLDPDAESSDSFSGDSDSVPDEEFTFPDSMEALEVPEDEEFDDDLDELTEQMLDEAAADESILESGGRSEPVLFDVLDESEAEEDSSGLSLINEPVDDEAAQSGFLRRMFAALGHAMQFLFWLLVAIALVYLLFGQIKDRLYPAYKNHAMVQQLRAFGCTFLPCDSASYDEALYEIVVSRMDEVQDNGRQLHVSIFLLNKAEKAQAYPNILLTLKTIDGTTVGQRVIQPQEYLTSHDSLISSASEETVDALLLVKPNKLGKILIKLDRPPVNAVGFEARVVE